MFAVHVDPLAILGNFSKRLNSFLGNGEPFRQAEFATLPNLLGNAVFPGQPALASPLDLAASLNLWLMNRGVVEGSFPVTQG